MADYESQEARIEAILGDYEDLEVIDDCVERFYRHLAASLQLPCEVTGIEDFRWEEFYVFGPGDPEEYEELRRTQPSYEDIYDLLAIEKDVVSEWMMFSGDDLGAHVRRKSDGKGLLQKPPIFAGRKRHHKSFRNPSCESTGAMYRYLSGSFSIISSVSCSISSSPSSNCTMISPVCRSRYPGT
ncbi:unnamed protein product, partial [marine sediment metagenome]